MAPHPPRNPELLRGLSLCSGVGGLDLGIHLAEPGYRTVGFVERDSFAASTLVARMEDKALDHAPIWDDLRSFDGRAWRGKVHIVSAGYPCQPFSFCGRRKGEDDPRHLWPDVRRVLVETRAPVFFGENVAGHLSLGFRDVAGDLQEMGYRVAARVVSAAEVGASHTRERLFILAYADGQIVGQPGLCEAGASRGALPGRSEPNGQPDRAEECDRGVVASGAADGGDGLPLQDAPLFPPEPSDLAQWREAWSRFDYPQPGLHRSDDGLVGGLERSSAAGLGVVPLAAAYAWRTLRPALNF